MVMLSMVRNQLTMCGIAAAASLLCGNIYLLQVIYDLVNIDFAHNGVFRTPRPKLMTL